MYGAAGTGGKKEGKKETLDRDRDGTGREGEERG